MNRIWNINFIEFCKSINFSNGLKEIFGIFYQLKEFHRYIWFDCFRFDKLRKFKYELFLSSRVFKLKFIWKTVVINPYFTNTRIIKLNHVEIDIKITEMVIKSLKSN